MMELNKIYLVALLVFASCLPESTVAFMNTAPAPSLITRQYRNENDLMTSLDSAVVLEDWYNRRPEVPDVTQQELLQRAARKVAAVKVPPAAVTAPSKPNGVVAHQVSIQSLDHLRSFVTADYEQQRYSVVKFYAPWCKTCAQVSMKYDKLVSKHGDWIERNQAQNQPDPSIFRHGSVRFASVDYSKNRDVFEHLDIQQLPTMHIYDHEGNLVADFACPPSEVPKLSSLVKDIVSQHEEKLQKKKLSQTSQVKVENAKTQATETKEPTRQPSILEQTTVAAFHLSYRSRAFLLEDNDTSSSSPNPYVQQKGKRAWFRKLRLPLGFIL